ncbi:MAG: cbb3-type cytochrome c oxidase subunit I [Myxococcales bacterium]|jgi:nitric oxide reductase subunit B
MVASRKMTVAPAWAQVAVVTFALGFGILGYLAYRIHADHPPVPERYLGPDGAVLFTREEILAGQQIFATRGFMEHGTIFGHGAYLGPDFTADALHRMESSMHDYYGGGPDASALVRADLKANRFDGEDVVWTAAQVAAWEDLAAHYTEWLTRGVSEDGLRGPRIEDPAEMRAVSSYVAWSAWVATARRPNTDYSYTNNWPPDPAAGNTPTADMILWSALSLIALLAGIGATLFAFGRWQQLGWHKEEPEPREVTFRAPGDVRLTPAQRATVWYFLVVAGLFLAQGLCGGANAHYHADPSSFFGIDIANWFPYNLTRTWHVQLAIFFVSSSYLAMGIFLAPMIAGSEPLHQEKLAIGLFVALVLVVVASLTGEYLSYHGYLDPEAAWWFGAQGWEYLDLGRVFQIALTAGLVFWVIIVYRGLRSRLAHEHPGNMPWLFLYSTLSIPLFYGVGMVFGPRTNFAVMDFWRFWVVHLWVEDFLELFTTIAVAYVFVLLGVVHPKTATRLVYLDVILYSIGGVVGTMHHLYFSGAPAIHMALGAFFSAMEVIPLVLLTYEAWRFMRLGSAQPGETVVRTSDERFPHRWAVMFLVAVGFWNFVGAGIFGFLINLPIVSYWEIGTQFTANHGHAAMMGVYGMLAIGFFLFVARYFVPADRGAERAMKTSFWALNGGLAWMVVTNLFPIGALQFYDAVANGYWHARSPEFFAQPVVHILEWARLVGDTVFIVFGILPLLYLAIRMIQHRKRPGRVSLGEATDMLTKTA